MTEAEFFRELKKVKGPWRVDSLGCLRHAITHCCPLVAVARRRRFRNIVPYAGGDAAVKLKMNTSLAGNIIVAADRINDTPSLPNEMIRLQQRLLKTLRPE